MYLYALSQTPQIQKALESISVMVNLHYVPVLYPDHPSTRTVDNHNVLAGPIASFQSVGDTVLNARSNLGNQTPCVTDYLQVQTQGSNIAHLVDKAVNVEIAKLTAYTGMLFRYVVELTY